VSPSAAGVACTLAIHLREREAFGFKDVGREKEAGRWLGQVGDLVPRGRPDLGRPQTGWGRAGEILDEPAHETSMSSDEFTSSPAPDDRGWCGAANSGALGARGGPSGTAERAV